MVTVTYNGQNIEIPDGKIATFQCNGKVMKSNVTIDGSSAFAYVNYNGKETRIEESSATLPCEGKVMKSDFSVDTKHCAIVLYGEDDTTQMDGFIADGDVTVTVVELTNTATQVVLKFTRSDGTEFTWTLGYTGAVLEGVTDDKRYYRAKYETGDFFTLEGGKVHRVYLRAMALWYTYYFLLWGLGYDEGRDYKIPNSGVSTWSEWVNDTECNTIGAQIVDGRVYTSDRTKILHDSNGVPVNESDTITLKAEYTFVDV